MKELNFNCSVKKIQRIESSTEDIDKEEGVITLETKDAEKIIIRGEEKILEGIKPKGKFMVTVKSAQKTIKESIKN